MLGILSTALALGEQIHPARYRRLNARPTSSPVPPVPLCSWSVGLRSRASIQETLYPATRLAGRQLGARINQPIHPRWAPVREASDRAPLEKEGMDLTNRQRPARKSVTTLHTTYYIFMSAERAHPTPRLV